MGVWGAAIQGVLAVDSSIGEGIASKKQADANTALANTATADAFRRGSQEAGDIRQGGAKLAARQHVAFAASGVDASVGTAADVISSTAAGAELEALTVENNAAREAWGYKKHGLAFQTQAGLDASRRNRETAGTVLGAIGQGVSAWNSGRGGGE